METNSLAASSMDSNTKLAVDDADPCAQLSQQAALVPTAEELDLPKRKTGNFVQVMGRSSPDDKILLVQALRRTIEDAALTGDENNDAPAFHMADIGLAMGIQGNEVGKEISDIFILDDNSDSAVKVVRWGRSVYVNIQKFIQFQLTVNVAALVMTVVAAISFGHVPLNAFQIDPVQPAQVLPRRLVLQGNAAGPIQLQKQPPLIDSTTLARLIIIVATSLGLMIVVAIFCRRKQNSEPAADAADPVRPNVTYNFSIIGSLFSAA